MLSELTGKWTCKQDGGTYFLRMIPNDVNEKILIWHGSGEYKDPNGHVHTWSNIAKGDIIEKMNRATGEKIVTIAMFWADVPSGSNRANGHLNLTVRNDSKGKLSLVKIENGSSPYVGQVLVKAKAPETTLLIITKKIEQWLNNLLY